MSVVESDSTNPITTFDASISASSGVNVPVTAVVEVVAHPSSGATER